MSVVEMHPEELFDKLEQGTLTAAEGERLRAHLAACPVCRFEVAVRGDFRLEASSAPRALAPAPQQTTRRSRAKRASLWARTPGRRVWVVAAAAALLLIGSGALAARFSGALFGAIGPSAPAAPLPSSSAKVPLARAAVRAAPLAAPSAAPPDAPASAPAVAPLGAPAVARPVNGPAAVTADSALGAASAAGLFAAANRARARGDVAQALALYRALQQQFPRSAEAGLSELTSGTLMLHSGDARRALAGFDAYLRRGARPLEAEALVGRAAALGALGRTEEELRAWRKVAERYPGSAYARRASERLGVLSKR